MDVYVVTLQPENERSHELIGVTVGLVEAKQLVENNALGLLTDWYQAGPDEWGTVTGDDEYWYRVERATVQPVTALDT